MSRLLRLFTNKGERIVMPMVFPDRLGFGESEETEPSGAIHVRAKDDCTEQRKAELMKQSVSWSASTGGSRVILCQP